MRSTLPVVALVLISYGAYVNGQGRGASATAAPPMPTGKAAAPIDLTGYWVSVVTEDWRWRMVTPAKGDYASVPITAAAKAVADAWDPAKDEAAGEQCKAYGAAAIMRVPGRLHITWQDDETLKVETDAGMQTRLLHFKSPKARQSARTWQGESTAEWQLPGPAGRRDRGAESGEETARAPFGALKVVTKHMRSGYLRKNGVPYSADAVLTEFWDLYKERNGTEWLVITSAVEDPKYLQLKYLTSPNFKKERDGSKWDPRPCSSR